MVGYHLMTKGHSVSWGLGGAVLTAPPPPPPAGPGQCPDNNKHININIFGVSYKITIKSQPQVPHKVVLY